MITEMAANYVVGLVPSTLLSVTHFYSYRRDLRKPSHMLLQENLQQLKKYWSESQSMILPLAEGSPAKDQKQYEKSLMIFATICFFTSWLGFVLHLVVFLSISVFAVSRTEKKLFTSELVTKKMSPEQVQLTLTDLLL